MIDRFGLFRNPIPFRPYPGIMARFNALFARPVVRALIERVKDGVRIPNFIPPMLVLPSVIRGVPCINLPVLPIPG